MVINPLNLMIKMSEEVMSNLKLKLLLLTILAIFVSSIGTAYAYDDSRSYSKHSSAKHSNKYTKSNKALYKSNRNRYAQNNIRSKSDVMREVKQRYNAKVLKISLNDKSGIYYVRVLMPNGKVRSLQVSARN